MIHIKFYFAFEKISILPETLRIAQYGLLYEITVNLTVFYHESVFF